MGSAWMAAALCSMPLQVHAANAPESAKPVIVVLGDSISAEYGLPRDTGWVALMRKRLADGPIDYSVANASISGDTTSGGRARLPELMERLEHEADRARTQRGTLVFAEFGELAAQQPNRAGTRTVQTGEQAQQCRLARAGRTDDRHATSGSDS